MPNYLQNQDYQILNIDMDMGVKISSQMNVKTNQYGDGYKQLYSFGINNKVTNWNGSKTGDYETVIEPIQTFLEDHKGVKPFYWLDPHNKTKLYTCSKWDISQNKANMWNISLSFEQFINA